MRSCQAEDFCFNPPMPTEMRAFIWDNGSKLNLGTLGGTDSCALYVNESCEGGAYLFGYCRRPGWPWRTFQGQKSRKDFRCHASTVSGFTMMMADRHSAHAWDSQAQKKRSVFASRDRLTKR